MQLQDAAIVCTSITTFGYALPRIVTPIVNMIGTCWLAKQRPNQAILCHDFKNGVVYQEPLIKVKPVRAKVKKVTPLHYPKILDNQVKRANRTGCQD